MRILKEVTFPDDKRYIEVNCTSAEQKPTANIIMGSIATEVDTGKVFFFNETSGEWVEQFSFQG